MVIQSQLVMRSGPNPGKTFTLNKPEMYIGRDISNDIVINDAEVSRKHVRFILQGFVYVIEDLGSTNGTFINGERIAGPHTLTSGENIQLGENVVLVYESTTYDPDSTAVMSPRDMGRMDAPAAEMPAIEPEPMPEMEMEPEPEPSDMMEPEPAPMYTPPPPPAQTMADPEPFKPHTPEPSATYTGQSATMAPPPMPAEAPPKKSRRGLLIGCGCLVVVLCLAVVGTVWYIDANSLWCSWLGIC